MKIRRNKAIVAKRFIHLNTYQVKEYFWGLISHDELINSKDLGYDLIVVADKMPRKILIMNKERKIKEIKIKE